MPNPRAEEPTQSLPNSRSPEFSVLEIIRDPDGVAVVITERNRDGRVSFSLIREYEISGSTRQTNFLNRRHIAAVRRLLDDLEEHETLELHEDRGRTKRRGAVQSR